MSGDTNTDQQAAAMLGAVMGAVDAVMAAQEKPLVDLALSAYRHGVQDGTKVAQKFDQLMGEMLAALIASEQALALAGCHLHAERCREGVAKAKAIATEAAA